MEIEDRYQWVDPETNQLYWLTKEQMEELAEKNG